tara:strand:+ start:769 stop:2487 length:1719 start_codon:yes stop_codon:yes gene_type:complete
MTYIFPKRVLRDKDVLDPVDMNADYVPVSELCSGHLNAHNFRDDVDFAPATNALFSHSYSATAADHGMGNAGPPSSSPNYAPPNTSSTSNDVRIPNTQVWTSIESTEITTGSSSLWITGFAQYFWLFWRDSNTSTSGYAYHREEFADGTGVYGGDGEYAGNGRPAAVQLALRVDGAVVEWTITGKQNPFEHPAVPMRPFNSTASKIYTPDYVNRTTACGPEMLPVRLGTVFPVSPGTHTVEIVARRLPRPTDSYTDTDDHVHVFNRQLFVMDMPTLPQSTVTSSSVDVTTMGSETVLSAAALGTNAVDATRNALNDIRPGAVARGTFTRDHIASPVAYTSQVAFSTTPATTMASYNHYPEFGSESDALVTEDVTTSNYNDSDWFNLKHQSGTSTTYLSTNDAAASTTGALNSTDTTVLAIYANVDVTELMYYQSGYSGRSNSNGNRFRDVVGCFKLAYKSTDGNYYFIQASEANVNKTTWWMRDGGGGPTGTTGTGHLLQDSDKEPVSIDVPLFGVIECSAGGSATTVDASTIVSIGVFVSVLQMGNTSAQTDNEVFVEWERASLQVFQLKV